MALPRLWSCHDNRFAMIIVLPRLWSCSSAYFRFANSLATIFIFATISNFAFENGFAMISNFTFAMITKSDFIAIDNEKCFHSSLRLHKLLISKLDVLKIHIRSLRSTR